MTSVRVREILGAVALVAAAAASAPVQAQQSGGAQRPQAGLAQRMGRQRRLDPQQRLERRAAMLTEQLSLSQGQVARVRPILQREQEQMTQLFGTVGFGRDRADGSQSGARNGGSWGRQRPDPGTPDGQRGVRPDSAQLRQFRAGAEQIRAATRQELARVLNAGQLQKYDALRPEAGRNAWGQRRGGGWERGGRVGAARGT